MSLVLKYASFSEDFERFSYHHDDIWSVKARPCDDSPNITLVHFIHFMPGLDEVHYDKWWPKWAAWKIG